MLLPALAHGTSWIVIHLPPTYVCLTSPCSSFKILFNITSSMKLFFHLPLNILALTSAYMTSGTDLDWQVSSHIAFVYWLVYAPTGHGPISLMSVSSASSTFLAQSKGMSTECPVLGCFGPLRGPWLFNRLYSQLWTPGTWISCGWGTGREKGLLLNHKRRLAQRALLSERIGESAPLPGSTLALSTSLCWPHNSWKPWSECASSPCLGNSEHSDGSSSTYKECLGGRPATFSPHSLPSLPLKIPILFFLFSLL